MLPVFHFPGTLVLFHKYLISPVSGVLKLPTVVSIDRSLDGGATAGTPETLQDLCRLGWEKPECLNAPAVPSCVCLGVRTQSTHSEHGLLTPMCPCRDLTPQPPCLFWGVLGHPTA